MRDERIAILKMLEEGKITLEEATTLIEAVERTVKPVAASTTEYTEYVEAPSVELLAESVHPTPSEIPAAVRATQAALEQVGVSGVDVHKLTEMKIHGVTAEFIREMTALGLPDLTADRLIEMHIHGVAPKFVREIREAGFSPSVRELIEMRVHNVSADYYSEMLALELEELTIGKLLHMYMHDVTPEFVREIRETGFNPSTGQLIDMRVHGLSAEYFVKMQAMGFEGLTIGTLVKMSVHGVTPEFVAEMRATGAPDLTPQQLIEMRIHGVDVEYMETMRELV